MQLRCPECDARGNVPHEALGRKIKCPRCGTVFKATVELALSGAERRGAQRVNVRNVDMDFGIVAGTALVREMSTTGVGFEAPDTDMDFDTGELINCAIVDGQKPVLQNVRLRIARKEAGFFGAEFMDLSGIQLEELKRFLTRKHHEELRSQPEKVDIVLDEAGSWLNKERNPA